MDVLDLAKELIRFDTEIPPGNEEECARYLRDQIEDLRLEGCSTDLHTFEPKRANLVARVGPDAPGLLLSGHIDRKSTRLNSSHSRASRMPSSA